MVRFEHNNLMEKELSRLDMEIKEASYVYIDKSWVIDTCASPFTRIYLITKGQAEIFCNGEIISLLPGNIYIVPANSQFRHRCDGTMEKLYFHINLLMYDKNDILCEIGRCVTLKGRQERIDELVGLYKQNDVTSAIRIKSRLYDIVFEALDEATVSHILIKQYSEITKQALKYIDRNLRSGLSIQEIAGRLGISRSSLQSVFKSEVGVPIGTYIRNRVFYECEKMIRTTDAPISRVAEQFGFCDQFHFSRAFSKCYGLSPLQYRKLKT